MSDAPAIAYFVSPHGFGHASRAVAVMEAAAEFSAAVRFEVFTTVPEWFFPASLDGRWRRHPLRSDVGLVQRSALEEDPAATVEALERFLPFDDERLDTLAHELEVLGCTVVVADIAPLGIAVAERAGLPSVLVENFTWDWIYEGYFEPEPRLRQHAEYLARWFEKATRWIQTEPFCRPVERAVAVPPVSRVPGASPEETRGRLDLGADERLMLLTMGGTPVDLPFAARLERHPELVFAVLADVAEVSRRGRLIQLPHRSPIAVPDLLAAADAIVGKVGYSTVAEAWAAGQRYAMVERPGFREVPILSEFVREHLPAIDVTMDEYRGGGWIDRLPALLERSRPERRQSTGARDAAREILQLLPPG